MTATTEPAAPGHALASHKALVSDETFKFREISFPGPNVTGAQVAQAAGAHPPDDFVVLQQLDTLELETLRPTETVVLAGLVRFFVIKGSGTDRFTVDGLALEWPRKELEGLDIKRLIGRDQDDIDLLLELEGHSDKVIEDDDIVKIGAGGVEHLRTRPAQGHITILVDGESYEPPTRVMTPNEIIIKAAGKDPSTHYLVQITKHGRVSYRGKGDVPIRLRNRMSFQVISTGPTPVSDPRMKTGTDVFMEGLRALGYVPAQVGGMQDHIAFDYPVETGKFSGARVRLGLVIPQDFPMTPPTGPYVTPEIHPIKTDGAHPLGAVHKEQAKVFDNTTGLAWQYWSRPYPNWPSSKRTVAAYMSHIWKLWDSQ